MLSKNLNKFIHSLEQKKIRQREGAFVAEGPKVVGDLMRSFTPRHIIATSQWLNGPTEDLLLSANSPSPQTPCPVTIVTDDELRKASLQQHPQQVIAIFNLPETTHTVINIDATNQLVLALDGVQDPGNLGTIIRIADWFGISTLLCSRDTADAFNPKVVQATMGSLARVHIIYCDLPETLASLSTDIPLYGTFLDGNDLYSESLTPHGVIIMGNEGNGISPTVSRLINRRLLIPGFVSDSNQQSETRPDSLNVAIATAITCAEFRRRTLHQP